ncbi:MAG: phosphocholine cytidylyltransferase family protein [candidate division Zixibacteria bacterium]|nr:phosphocholine cytidylyltransferase family protein [candidate division Zixibacteria bacterium]
MTGVILAAGVGARLGVSHPKGLLELPTGETILGRQVRLMRDAGIEKIIIVVGYHREEIESALDNVRFVHNAHYDETNTAKSLLCALDGLDDDVLWANGDVVFDKELVPLMLASGESTVLVNASTCGEEEVKYIADSDGRVLEISKTVTDAQGEALGLNVVRHESLSVFVEALRQCEDRDYFEHAMQIIIDQGAVFKRVLIGQFRCTEIDFEEDWQRAQRLFSTND